MKESWHKKVLKKYKKEIISGAISAIAFASALLLWHFVFGKTFVWTNIEPISAPLSYVFYSALVFMGPGAFLFYFTDFYKDLASFFRDTLNAPGLHKGIKKVIWFSMAAAVFIVVSAVVYLLNAILSFFYNVFGFILYLSPPLGAGLIAFTISYLLLKKNKITI